MMLALVPVGEGAADPGALQPNAGLGPSGHFDSCLPWQPMPCDVRYVPKR